MGAIQTEFTKKSGVAYPGMIGDVDSANRVISRVAEGVIEFGLGTFRGTNKDTQAKVVGVAHAGGTIIDTSTFAITDQDGLTVLFQVDGGITQTLLFASATTTAAHVIAAINVQIKGVIASASGDQVLVSSLSTGKKSSVVVIAGGTSALTWADPVSGKDANFLGVAVRDHVNPEAYLGRYVDKYGGIGIISEGPVWVELETTGAPGDVLTVDVATGRIGTAPVDATHSPIDAELDTTVTAVDGLALITLAA